MPEVRRDSECRKYLHVPPEVRITALYARNKHSEAVRNSISFLLLMCNITASSQNALIRVCEKFTRSVRKQRLRSALSSTRTTECIFLICMRCIMHLLFERHSLEASPLRNHTSTIGPCCTRRLQHNCEASFTIDGRLQRQPKR